MKRKTRFLCDPSHLDAPICWQNQKSWSNKKYEFYTEFLSPAWLGLRDMMGKTESLFSLEILSIKNFSLSSLVWPLLPFGCAASWLATSRHPSTNHNPPFLSPLQTFQESGISYWAHIDLFHIFLSKSCVEWTFDNWFEFGLFLLAFRQNKGDEEFISIYPNFQPS